MTANPASDTSVDPLDYYETKPGRKLSYSSQVRVSHSDDLKGVYAQPHPADLPRVTTSPECASPVLSSRSSKSRAMEAWWGFLRTMENVPVIGHIVSAGYACAGSKDKAERAGLKATVGLLMCVCNFPTEAVDECIRKVSPKLDSPGLMNRRDWMKRHRRRQLRHLCLPGSHQSATYNMAKKLKEIPLIEGWSRCQKLSISAQLYGGIRFFDLRLMSYDSDIWLHHNLVVCRRFREVLENIGDFVTENPTEIVFIHLSSDGKAVDWSLCQSYVHEYFGDRLVMEHMRDMLIGDIVDQGRNIIIAGMPNVAYSWRGIQNRWPNKQWPYQLKEDMEITMSDMSRNPPTTLFWYKAECTPDPAMVVRNLGGVPGVVAECYGGDEKFEFIEDLASAVNNVVYEVVQGVTKMPFNVLSTDYVQDDIVGHIIQLNDEADEGLYTADESADNLDEVFTETTTLVAPEVSRGPHQTNTSISNISVSTARSNMSTSFDIRLKPAPPVEVKETNM